MAQGLGYWGVSTSEDLVKALKRPESTKNELPERIELLEVAWDDQDMYIPKKTELLFDAALEILTEMGKDKMPKQHFLNHRYWRFLGKVLETDLEELLHSLAGKYNFLQLTSNLLTYATSSLWEEAAPIMAILLRASIQRHGAAQIDSVNTCFRDLFQAIPKVCDQKQVRVTHEVLSAMVRYWRPALELGANAKKTTKFFINESMKAYAAAHVHVAGFNAAEFTAALSEVSELSLFGPTVFLSQKETQEIPDTLNTLTNAVSLYLPNDEAMLLTVPEFLSQLVHATRGNSNTQMLPTQQRRSILEHFIAPVCAAIRSCLRECGSAFATAATKARYALVLQIRNCALYQRGSEDELWTTLWTQLCADTLTYLTTTKSTSTCFETLSIMWNVHSESLARFQTGLLAATTNASQEAWDSAQSLVAHIMSHYAQLREIPDMVNLACHVLKQVSGSLEACEQLAQSPFFCRRTVELWEMHFRDGVSHNQALPLLQVLLHTTQSYFTSSKPTFLCTSHLLLLAVKQVGLNQGSELESVLESIGHLADLCIKQGEGSRADQLIMASGLRIRFALLRRALTWALATDESLPAYAIVPNLENIGAHFSTAEPQLVVEVFRIVLGAAEAAQCYNREDSTASGLLAQMIQTPLLTALQSRAKGVSCNWDGQIFGMPPSYLPVALWRLIIRRYTAVLDASASAQLIGLTTYLQSTLENEGTGIPGMLAELSRMALRDANFLEQPNWREAILDTASNAISWINVDQSPDRPLDGDAVHKSLTSVILLDALPTTYLLRPGNNTLFADLVWLDAALTVQGAPTPWTHLKRLLCRLAGATNWVPEVVSLESYYLALSRLPFTTPSFVQSSMKFLQVMLGRRPLNLEILPNHLATLPFQQEMAHHVLITTLEWLVTADVRPSLEQCRSLFQNVTFPDFAADWDASTIHRTTLSLRAYTAKLHLEQAMGMSIPKHDGASQRLIEAVGSLCIAVRSGATSPNEAELLAGALFATLVAMRSTISLPRPYVRLSMVFAALHATIPDAAPRLLSQFIAVTTQMESNVYDETLETIEAAFAENDVSETLFACDEDYMASLLVLLGLLLQHGPSGTSRIASAHFSSVLVRLPQIARRSTRLTIATVEVLGLVCNYRALILRPVDIPRIFSLISVLTGPCASANRVSKDTVHASTVFIGIVSALRAILRLRKDLLGTFLPQLTEILCVLLPLLQTPQRQNLGRAQLRQLAMSVPAWLDVVGLPLGAAEAQALCRLYSEIPTKSTSIATIVAHKRRRISSEYTSTNESLARPMSKHAVYILVAYVRSVTQGTSTLATPVRQELQAGLFALCDLVGKYERDAVLKGMLDASSQVVFKALWSDWERQRYKGS